MIANTQRVDDWGSETEAGLYINDAKDRFPDWI